MPPHSVVQLTRTHQNFNCVAARVRAATRSCPGFCIAGRTTLAIQSPVERLVFYVDAVGVLT